MRLSIRTKLFFSLTSLLLFFICMSLSLTLLGLENFYLWQQKHLLIASSNHIDDLYLGNAEEVSLELERIGNTLGAGITLITKEGYVAYSSFAPIVNQKLPDRRRFSTRVPPPEYDRHPSDKPPSFHFPPYPILSSPTKEIIDPQTTLDRQQDPDLKIEFFTLERQLKTGDTLVIRQALAHVSESAALAVKFISFTGLLSIILGSIWAFFFAKKFTRPILDLNRIAQSIAQLDFSHKSTLPPGDELGQLGSSINHLSTQLDTAISELSQKNQQLIAEMEKERKLDHMRKDFVSSVSHELKTPLALILGYAEGLQENIAHDEESRNYYASVIMDEAQKMDKLVKDLLGLAQLESGFYQLHRTTFAPNPLLNEIAQKYEPILIDKGIRLEITPCPNDLVYADRLRVEQILLNLLHNAIDHTEFTKVIRIFTADSDEDHLRIFVHNTGRPIPEESLEKIWTSFYKVDKSRAREYGGYGLGLSIVRALQELHGNPYGATNDPEGVLFWFDIDQVKI